ncbi:hypothetical protein IV417_07620 [Alphaproteobacteria bacterium KMM 3653]|uniref:Uncharacterized protein n=1 Tax=Harenicola maris TaxID=2841044 RepID=A0AAP2CNQ1_9RHOB|nr:hypothetical protein [Harenicola maris]
MSKKIIKGVFAASAMVIAGAAVGYTQIATFKAPAAQTAAAVQAESAAPKAQAVEVAAFVTSTRQMARPAFATLADMQEAPTLLVAAGEDDLVNGPSTGDVMDDIDISDLLDGLNSDGQVPGLAAMPQSRPEGPRVAATTPRVTTSPVLKPQAITRTKSKSRRVKRSVWSTGQYR